MSHPMPDPTVADRVLHQFPQPGLLEKRTPATISFTSPKLSRKASLPGSLRMSRSFLKIDDGPSRYATSSFLHEGVTAWT